MELPTKMCPCCKKHEIKNWESTCWWCWQYLKWHDGEHGTDWRNKLMMLNHIREELRACGMDPILRAEL